LRTSHRQLAGRAGVWLALSAVVLTSAAIGAAAQDNPLREAAIKVMAGELRQLPALPVASSGDAARWNAFLRRIRESPEALRMFAAAANGTPVSLQPSVAQAFQLLATGRTADGNSVRALDLAPVAEDLGWLAVRFSHSRVTLLSVLASLGAGAGAAKADVLDLLEYGDHLEDEERIGIANVLGAMGPPARDLLPVLQKLVQDSKGDVRSAARAAYSKIAGSDRNLADPAPGGILLLPGYEHSSSQGIDSTVGRIQRVGGDLTIAYDIGPISGPKAEGIEQFLWSRRQMINGQLALFVMQKDGHLTVTFERGSANFDAYPIRTEAELADVVLMLSTYMPAPWPEGVAPEHFKVRLDTSRGVIVIAVHTDWAYLAAQRFHELVRSGYYDGARFFRVLAGSLAQFGIAGDPALNRTRQTEPMSDDSDQGISNRRGTVAFDFHGADSRTTQVFINLKDNAPAYASGSAIVLGEVVEGMDVVDNLYAEYGDRPGGGMRDGRQDVLLNGGNTYLTKNFPLLDYIRTARIVPR